MSRYYSYNDFMSDVLIRTDEVCREKHGSSLQEYANVSESVMQSILSGIVGGLIWSGPVIIVPPLMPVFVLGAIVRGVARSRYSKKRNNGEVLIEAVRKIGARFKSRWEKLDGYKVGIDSLMDEAAECLLREVRSY